MTQVRTNCQNESDQNKYLREIHWINWVAHHLPNLVLTNAMPATAQLRTSLKPSNHASMM